MSRSLNGITVAHFEARRATELDGLIARHGGAAWPAPALSEVPIEAGAEELGVLEELASGAFELIVLLTGIGTQRLFDEAALCDRLDGVTNALGRAIVVSRGPKPVPVLRRYGLKPAHVAPDPHTTHELLATLDTLSVSGRRVLVATAGEPFPEPSASLRSRNAHPVELQLYRWALSIQNVGRLDQTIDEIIAGRIDAVLFTTQVQVRHVFEVANRGGRAEALSSALREHVLIGSVGPTVTEALRERGLAADVVPKHPKMGHLVVALAEHVVPRERGDLALLSAYGHAVPGGRGMA
jgi:uroporphyrinogen-III synthase